MAEHVDNKSIQSYLRHPDFQFVCWFSDQHPNAHFHRDFYELVVVISGHGTHTTNNISRQVTHGDIFLIPPGQVHKYSEYDNLKLYNLIFSVEMMRYFLPDLTNQIGFQRIFGTAAESFQANSSIRIKDEYYHEIFVLLEEMSSLRTSSVPGAQTTILSDFIKVVNLISLHSEYAEQNSKCLHIEKISNFLHSLENNCAESWSLNRMANCCSMSVSNFRQIFRQLTGVAPLEYLIRLRLFRAVVMLESTDYDLEKIAQMCGFCDANYLSRLFRKNYSVTPYRYRKEYLQGQRTPLRLIRSNH